MEFRQGYSRSHNNYQCTAYNKNDSKDCKCPFHVVDMKDGEVSYCIWCGQGYKAVGNELIDINE